MPYVLRVDEDMFKEHVSFEVSAVPWDGVPDGAEVALAGPEGVYALGKGAGGEVVVDERIDSPVAVEAPCEPGLHEVDEAWWKAVEAGVEGHGPVEDYIVNLSLPIEARSEAEAARLFWSYVRLLGPENLPLFIAPYGNELEGQAYLQGVPHEGDPEEE
ncbi:hypothetical protein [Salininema proteolyticum]|uniref:DUF4265 domain-containing protein n=1 Tax=Salininema proteolyticum TaxID=1607685 RepID=A0ABV8TSE5_9ACTN